MYAADLYLNLRAVWSSMTPCTRADWLTQTVVAGGVTRLLFYSYPLIYVPRIRKLTEPVETKLSSHKNINYSGTEDNHIPGAMEDEKYL